MPTQQRRSVYGPPVSRVPDSRERRASERAKVPLAHALRFVASADGVDYVEATIVDISLGGIGIMQTGPNVPLEAGMLLKGCRIEIPGGDAFIVDLEVRHTEQVALADGTPAQHAGCRFLNLPRQEAIEQLTGKRH